MYRPEEWEKNKKLDCAKCAFVDSKPSSDCWFCGQNYEAGADAMLKALRERGWHVNGPATFCSLAERCTLSNSENTGTYLFIPDEAK